MTINTNSDQGSGATASGAGSEAAHLFSSVDPAATRVPDPAAYVIKKALDRTAITAEALQSDPIVTAIRQYWEEKLPRLGDKEKNKALEAIPKIEALLALHINIGDSGAGAERFFAAVLAYDELRKNGVIEKAQGEFDHLRLLGIEPSPTVQLPNGKGARVGLETMWGRLIEIGAFLRARGFITTATETVQQVFESRSAQASEAWLATQQRYHLPQDMTGKGLAELEYFRNRPLEVATAVDAGALRHHYLQHAEAFLAQRVHGPGADAALPVHIPLNVMMLLRNEGAIAPDFATLVQLNKALAAGGACFLFCCPDYKRTQLEGGQWHYDMDGLNTGPGLTAEKAIPVVGTMLARLAHLAAEGQLKRPGRFFVGTADFEATEANAECTQCGSVNEFLRRLNLSVQSIAEAIEAKVPLHLNVDPAITPTDTPIQRIDLVVSHGDQAIAHITLGALTDCLTWAQTYRPGTDQTPFLGRQSFDELVALERVKLVSLVDSNPNVQRQIDTLITLRLELLLEWADASESTTLKALFEPFNGNRADFVRAMQAAVTARASNQGLDDRQNQLADALVSLRRRVVVQGAEYAVMSKIMKRCPSACQLVADAANMWQVFGDKSIPRLQIKGGYSGADVVDLS